MSAVRTIGFNEGLQPDVTGDGPDVERDPEYVWVRFAADQAPSDGLDYRAAIDGEGPGPTQVTEKAILEDVVAMERAARRLRKLVAGLTDKTVEIVPPPKEPPPIDEAMRERARRALAKSGFVRIKP